MVTRRYNQWHKQEPGRAYDQVNPRAEEQVDLAHIVRGRRHGIANWLQAVKGHALTQQGSIQLVADIPLQPLTHDFGAKIAPNLQTAAQDLGPTDPESG